MRIDRSISIEIERPTLRGLQIAQERVAEWANALELPHNQCDLEVSIAGNTYRFRVCHRSPRPSE